MIAPVFFSIARGYWATYGNDWPEGTRPVIGVDEHSSYVLNSKGVPVKAESLAGFRAVSTIDPEF